MSDNSGYSSASQSSEEDGHATPTDDGDLHDLDSKSEDDASEADGSGSDGDQKEEIDFSNLHLCPKHNAGEMVDSCINCSAAFSFIKDKKRIEELSLNKPSGSGSGLLARYEGRCDSIPVTLHLSSDTVKFAHKVFTQGVWKDARLFKETVKKFLLLPPEQHELLSADIQCEESLNQL